MKIRFLILILIFGTASYSQSAKKMLSELENKWKVDENGEVTFTRIVELPNVSKEEIFNRAVNYYKYHYGNAKSVSQTKDVEKGIISRKAMYEDAHDGYNIQVNHLNVWHVLTFSAKDNVAVIDLKLTDYEQITEKYLHAINDDSEKLYKWKVKDCYPVNPKGDQKTIMTKTF